jgi:hypothetical protein
MLTVDIPLRPISVAPHGARIGGAVNPGFGGLTLGNTPPPPPGLSMDIRTINESIGPVENTHPRNYPCRMEPAERAQTRRGS